MGNECENSSADGAKAFFFSASLSDPRGDLKLVWRSRGGGGDAHEQESGQKHLMIKVIGLIAELQHTHASF